MNHMITTDPNTELRRFDYPTMQQEWRDFLISDGGYKAGEPELIAMVAELTAKHGEIFVEALSEFPIFWAPIEGFFQIEAFVHMAHGGWPLTADDLDYIWAGAFDTVNAEHYDRIEEHVARDRDHRII